MFLRLEPLLIVAPLWVCALAQLFEVESRLAIQFQICVYALVVLALIQAILVRADYVRELGWAFLMVAHAMWFATPALYQALAPGIWFGDWIEMEIPNSAMVQANLLISMFLFANGLGYFVARRGNSDVCDVAQGMLVPARRRLGLVASLFVAGLVPYLAFGGSLVQIVQGIALGRGEKAWTIEGSIANEASPMMTVFWISRACLVGAAVLAGTFAVAGERGTRRMRLMFGSILVLTAVIIYFDQGTRSYLALIAMPVLTVFVLFQSRRGHRFRPARLAAIGLVAVFALLLVTQVQWMYREERTRGDIQSLSFVELLAPRQHIDFYTETANAVVVRDNILEKPLMESALLLIAVNPIPRALWPGKPVPVTRWHYSLYRWNIDIYDKGGNAMPSIVGQYYMNFGYVGVLLIGVLLGAFVRFVEQQLVRQRTCYEHLAVAASALTFVFLSFRFLAPGFHYSSVLLLLVALGFGRWGRRQSASPQHIPLGPQVASSP